MYTRHAARLTLACVVVCFFAATAAGAPARSASQTFNLADFGANGDDQIDDAPALQSALDALVAAGGGTLFVPAGRYVIATPVSVIVPDGAPPPSVEIRGVESGTPIPNPNESGEVLSRGLNLVSEFAPRTGEEGVAILLWNFRSLLVKDITFIGSPDLATDARVTLAVGDIEEAVIQHCEFYGLLSQVPGGSILQSMRTHLSLRETAFLGCSANSGVYAPVVQNWEWKGITVEDSIFIDYGQRAELYSKTGYGSPLSWINVGDALPPTPDSSRREVVLRRVFLDEGGWQGVTVQPALYTPNPVPIDLFYATGLYVNVSNFNTTGHYLSGVRQVLAEDSTYTWSHNAESAIHIVDAQDAVLDRIRTSGAATRLTAEPQTSRLTVIDSVYTDLASAAAQTLVLNPATPDDDPVRYVRAQFQLALGREPDAAAHYYWARLILDCDADPVCVATQREALVAYLATAPAPTFALKGRVTDEDGQPLTGVNVTFTGTHSAATLATPTGADGSYSFSRLPTSGAYTVAFSKSHYTFAPHAYTLVTPAGDRTLDLQATHNRYTIGGRLTDERGRAIEGATLTLSGAQAATTASDANGSYAFEELAAGGNYTVNVSSARHTFASPSQTFTNLDADRAADFDGLSRFYSVNGQVLDGANRPVAGLGVTLSGGLTGTTTTDAQGNFLFSDLPRGGSYTFTPERLLGNRFTPASAVFDNLTDDRTAVFVAVPTTYRIAGRVAVGGAGLAGVTLTLTGSKLSTTITDANGDYSFDVPVYGDYAVASSKTHYTFTPAGATFSGVVADRTADFVATLDRHRISGSVRRPNGAAMAGVNVTLSGGQTATTTTDAQGVYSFVNLPAGMDYTVAASKAGYDFAPASKSFTDFGADTTADFVATPTNVLLAGHVNAGGRPLAGVVVTLSGSKAATATTDDAGAYSFNVPAEGSYTVTPSHRNYTFTPAGATFVNIDGNRTADFSATLNRHTISGRIADQNNAAVAGATVTLSGPQTGTTTTDAQGNYAFPNLPAGSSYTLTAALSHYTFSPASIAVNDLGASSTSNNFTGTRLDYRIDGRVTVDGQPLAGATVSLTGTYGADGALAGTAATDANGAYVFTVPAGGDYTLKPSKKNYTFDRAATTFEALDSDQTADFAATLRTILGFAATNYTVGEGGGSLTVTVTREGDTTTGASAVYEGHGDTAKTGSDFVASIGQLTFEPGETSKTLTLFITDDAFVEGPERFTLTLTPSGSVLTGDAPVAAVTINDNDTTTSATNPVDEDEFFVREHYRDFFSREADAPGLKFWTDEIRKCGADEQCREARRVSVSAAFFFSIEFKETGFLVYRLYRATHGRVPVRVGEFMLDSRVIGEGVVVGAEGWAERLAANRKAFLEEWTQRPEFEQRFAGLDDRAFLQTLFNNMNVTPTEARRTILLTKLSAGVPRSEVLGEIIDDDQFTRQEFNRAFVLMQYFGYLRRNPSESPDSDLSGFNFWLAKLDEFGGDYERAEMVKAFIASTEYRGRFGN